MRCYNDGSKSIHSFSHIDFDGQERSIELYTMINSQQSSQDQKIQCERLIKVIGNFNYLFYLSII